jgi:EAL domain-containing protein (putative c-di-GMP-specific phosphodiesterase class I)
MLERILSETGMDPTCLELELTEGAMAVDLDKAISTLKRLKALGLRISIDDFGTGYSSLARLQQLPVDVVKIDKFFVQELETNPTARRIIDAIISLADVLGFEIVAEGIETEGQASILRSTRCHFLQGYLISRPLDAAAFAEMALSSTGSA